MPPNPKRHCRKPGCGGVADASGFCEQHRRDRDRQIDHRRGTPAERGYGPEWRKARAVFLVHHPWCVRCEAEGRKRRATHVDHIIPHRGDQALFWDRRNWQGLCAPHHNAKSAREGFAKRMHGR